MHLARISVTIALATCVLYIQVDIMLTQSQYILLMK